MGRVHCDIKPANIMVKSNGDVLVADFGIARMMENSTTTTMAGAGTPAYMAPEQVLGKNPVPQTDIYALGIVLYEMLTGGERPFTGEQAQTDGSTSEKVRWEQITLQPPSLRKYNPDISPQLEAVVSKCLQKKPEDRYADAFSLLNALSMEVKDNLREPVRAKEQEPIVSHPVEKEKILEPDAKEKKINQHKKQTSPLVWLLGGFAVIVLGLVLGGKLSSPVSPATEVPIAAEFSIVDEDSTISLPVLPVLLGTPIPYPTAAIFPQNAVDIEQLAQWGKGTINGVSWSPDGSLLALATSHGIRLLDALTLQEVLFIETTSAVSNLVFNPNGESLLAGTGDNNVGLWRTTDGKLLMTLQGHVGWVTSVAFSPDGQKIASGSSDSAVRVWRASDGSLLQTFERHTDGVQSVAFSPDGQTLASGGGDKTILIWRVSDGVLLKTLTGHTDWINSVTFSPNGNTLASSAGDKSMIIWNLDNGKQKCSIKMDNGMSSSLSFSPDGQWLAGDAIELARIWNAQNCSQVQIIDAPTGKFVHFSPDGNWLVAVEQYSSNVHRIRVTDWLIDQTLEWSPSYDMSIATSPSEEIVAVLRWSADGGIIDLRQISDGSVLRTFEPDPNIGNGIAFSPDGQILATGSGNTVNLWQISNGALLQTLNGSSGGMHNVVFSSDGLTLASATEENNIDLWSLTDGALLYTLKGHTEWITSLVFAPDGQNLASGSYDDTIRLWRVSDGAQVRTLTGHGADIEDVAFSPDGQSVASGGDDNTIRIWQASSGALLKTLEGHSGWVLSVAFSPDGKTLASGSADNTIRLWQIANGDLLQTLKGHTVWVGNVVFGSNGRVLASNSGDGTIAIWGVAP
jgi:WD40 repeat protein